VEARVVIVDGVDHRRVALTDLLDARERRIAVAGKRATCVTPFLSFAVMAGHRVGREVRAKRRLATLRMFSRSSEVSLSRAATRSFAISEYTFWKGSRAFIDAVVLYAPRSTRLE